jgi:protein-disulfide isomerase
MSVATVLALGSVLMGAGSQVPQCPPVTRLEEERLIHYVRNHLKVPVDAEIRMVREAGIGGSCHKRVRFLCRKDGLYINFPAVLLSDHVHLAPLVFDTSSDQAEATRRLNHARNAELTEGSPPAMGEQNADFTVVVFVDFGCMHCARLYEAIKRDSALEGQAMRIVFRHYPSATHPWAHVAAVAAACVADQSLIEFWKLHDYFLSHQGDITKNDVLNRAEIVVAEAGLIQMQQFQDCTRGKRGRSLVEADIELGRRMGILATPSVFINGRFLPAATLDGIRQSMADATTQR